MDIFNSLSNSLTKLDKAVHSKMEGTFIDNFIHELQEYLVKRQSTELLNNLPWHTALSFAKFEGNYAVCFDYMKKKIYYMPQENIIGPKPEPGEVLKVYSPGKFYVDYTGILANQDKIEEYLAECTIAK